MPSPPLWCKVLPAVSAKLAIAADENRSVWLAELPPYEPLPPLRGALSADVVILGGGITGVSTAWHLRERFPERRIVLLEARALAHGASGRNGGQVLNGINGVEPREPELARRVFEATHTGIEIVADLARRSTIDCGWSRRGCLEVYTTPGSAEEAQARVETWSRWGLPMRWLSAGEVGMHEVYGAVLDPTGGRVNSAALLRGLRPPLLERGVEIYEQTPALKVEPGAPVVVTTPEGEVRASALVLATGGYTPRLGFFRNGILPLHSHVVATEPVPGELLAGYDGFADDLDRIAYGCPTPGGRLLFGGGSNAAYAYRFGGAPDFPDDAPGAAWRFAAIEARMRRYFPGLAQVPVTYRWSGLLAITFDRVCSIGVTGPRRNIYHAVGFSGHGLALGALAGRVIRDLYAGDEAPWRGLPFLHKRLPMIPPEPLRWLGYQLYTRATGRSPRRR